MKFSSYITIAAMLATTACAGSGKSDKADSAADSVSTDTTAAATATPERLPDTTLASVSAVRYNVEVLDPTVDGRLDNLADLYASTPGAFTFRKGAHRQADFGGKVTGTPSEITVDWEFETAGTVASGESRWGGGSGWTGQPLYVEWPDSCLEAFRAAGVATDNLGKREIMVGSLAGRVYFINYDNGKASRPAVDVQNPIKGTISLDPTLNGNLYVGQGIPTQRPFGTLVIDLYKGEVTDRQGEDPKAERHWGAFDSSALRAGQFLFRPGENGTLYKYTVSRGRQHLHSTLRFTVNGAAPGIESSMSVYANYGFIADNAGNILGVNLDTMRPVWYYDLGDDVDASMTLMVEDGRPYIYVGCEIDKQVTGTANFVKLDGTNGSKVWETRIEGRRATVGEKHFDGGFYATALPGTGNCSDLVMVNCVLNTRGQNGQFMAFDRKTGRIVYTTPLRCYAWSSPVGMTNEKGEMFVITGDCAGNIYLMNGRDGKIITSRTVGHNFESSPVVVGNTIVVGSRGSKIFRMTIK